MPAATSAIICSALLVPVGLESTDRGAAQAAVDVVIQKLATADCATRWEALRTFLFSAEELQGRLIPLRERVKRVQKPMQGRFLPLIEFLEHHRMARNKIEPFRKQVERSAMRGNDRRLEAELERVRQGLMRIMNDPKEAFLVRYYAASYMSVLVGKLASEFPGGWPSELPKLLGSGDPQVRLIGSLLAARRGFLKGQEPEKGLVIPVLIGGLRGASFAERDLSQGALLQLTDLNLGQFCLVPTDPPEVRAASIRRWQEWWDQNRDRLAREKIPQG